MENTLEPQRDPITSTKLIVGLFFTAVGILMTAANFGVFEADRALRYWPVVIVVVGVVKLFDPERRMAGIVITVIGVALLAETAGWLRVSFFDLWPLVLVLIGARMVARALGIRPGLRLQATNANDIWAVVSSRKAANDSPDYRGGRVAALLSGVELDLTKAEIAHGPAVLECFVALAALEIFVPETWEVIGEVVPVMGGFDVRTASAADPRRQLIVRGTAVMGAIEVKRRKE